MVRFNFITSIVLLLFLLSAVLFGQDTTLTITNTGNVGIGITNPAVKLHVQGDVEFEKVGNNVDTEGRLILKTANLNDPGRFGIRFSNNIVAPILGDDIDNMYFGFFSGWGATRNYDAVVEIHGKATGSWGKALRLTHDGTDGYITTDTGNLILNPADGSANVGIGTTKPIDKFEVNGGAFTLDGASGLIAFRMRQSDSLRWTFLSAPWLGNDLRLRNEVTGVDVMVFDRVTNNVGIGTNSPMGALDVNGSIYQRGGLLHADYVFEKDYKLESIEDHTQFMWANKHLKAIPKATVDKNGREIVEVGSHQRGIVEELEKAHIYIDQLNNKIKILEEQLNILSAKLENDK